MESSVTGCAERSQIAQPVILSVSPRGNVVNVKVFSRTAFRTAVLVAFQSLLPLLQPIVAAVASVPTLPCRVVFAVHVVQPTLQRTVFGALVRFALAHQEHGAAVSALNSAAVRPPTMLGTKAAEATVRGLDGETLPALLTGVLDLATSRGGQTLPRAVLRCGGFRGLDGVGGTTLPAGKIDRHRSLSLRCRAPGCWRSAGASVFPYSSVILPFRAAYESGHPRPLGHVGCRCTQLTRQKPEEAG